MYKVLVVDDEPSIRDLLDMILKKEHYDVALAEDGNRAVSLLESFRPDIVVLDLMLPDISGHDLCRQISEKYKIPVIMLTAKDDIVDKVLGLELGADDYVTKPFDSRELIARVKALIRRLVKEKQNHEIIKYMDIELNLSNKTVKKSGMEIFLTPKEYCLLELFAKNPNKVFSREDLIEKAWGFDYLGDSRAVDISIARVRKKIEDNKSEPKCIITVFGFGYKFGGE